MNLHLRSSFRPIVTSPPYGHPRQCRLVRVEFLLTAKVQPRVQIIPGSRANDSVKLCGVRRLLKKETPSQAIKCDNQTISCHPGTERS